jgi:hypothetical protein
MAPEVAPAVHSSWRRRARRGRLARRCECANQRGSSDGRWTVESPVRPTTLDRARDGRFTTNAMTIMITSETAIRPTTPVIFKGYAGSRPGPRGNSIPQGGDMSGAGRVDFADERHQGLTLARLTVERILAAKRAGAQQDCARFGNQLIHNGIRADIVSRPRHSPSGPAI